MKHLSPNGTKRLVGLLLAIGAWFLASQIANGQSATVPPRPNLVFILADDLGPGEIGCYGGKIAKTPHLDQMAAEGIRFTRYYSASPICSPSRCGLITGQFPSRWRITSYLQDRKGNKACEMADFLDPKAPALPRVLKESGYHTAHFGKWHLGGGRDVVNPPKFAAYGIDEHAGTWESPEPHPDITATNWVWSPKDKVKRWERTAFYLNKTLDFLKRNTGEPCFVNVWLDDPHSPWVDNAEPTKGNEPKRLTKVMEENDRQIGLFLKTLKESGLDKNTIVIFASDNGPFPTLNGQRTVGLRGSKLGLYEGGIRLPFIAWGPGRIPAGKTDEATVIGAVDLFPSFSTLAGVKSPTKDAFKGDGVDLSTALLGQPAFNRTKPLYWEYGRNNTAFVYPSVPRDKSPWLATLNGPWKLLCMPDGSQTELYNIEKDPKETTNLAEEEKEKSRELQELLLVWKKGLP